MYVNAMFYKDRYFTYLIVKSNWLKHRLLMLSYLPMFRNKKRKDCFTYQYISR